MGRYSGQLTNVSNGPSIRHGQGTYAYDLYKSGGNDKDGDEVKTDVEPFYKYEGSWVNGVKDGKGTFTLRDHSVYTGDFLNGEITGQGRRSVS